MQARSSTPRQGNRSVRDAAGRVALLLVLLLVSTYGFSMLIGLATGMISALLGRTPDVQDGLLLFALSMLPVILADCLAILLARPLLGVGAVGLFAWGNSRLSVTALGAAACLGAGFVGGLMINPLLQFISFFRSSIPGGELALPTAAEPAALIVTALYICILAPVLEEILFRGLILRALRPYGCPFAVIFSCLLFSLFHMNLVQLAPPFLIGLVLCMVTLLSDSLWPAICCHMANNLIALLLDVFGDLPVLSIPYMVGGLLALGFFLLLHAPRLGPWFRPTPLGLPTTGQRLQTAMAAPATIVIFVLYALTIVISFLFNV